MIPPLRAVPPFPSQLAADPASAWTLYFGRDIKAVVLATAATGLGVSIEGDVARVTGSSAQLELLRTDLADRGSPLAEMLTRAFSPVVAWKLRRRSLPLDRGIVMGILNLTDDSFSGDGVGTEISAALRRAAELREAGAAIIDVGAETARADRPVLDSPAEASIVERAVTAMRRDGHCVSVDTYKPIVALAALEAGAELVNDISGLTLGTGAAEQAVLFASGYVLNYSYSVPKRRPDSPPMYGDVVAETVAWMFDRVAQLRALGLADDQVAIDPGIAFGKSHDEDLQVIRRIGELRTLGLPVLLAHSRKNYIGSVNARPPAERDLETHVSTALAYAQGARIFRVHDVAGTRRTLDMAHALLDAGTRDFAPDTDSWPWRAGASASHMTNSAPDKSAPAGQRW